MMTPDELSEVQRLHRLWQLREKGGKRAYLAGANLARANLAHAYLAGANLARANLEDAYLAGANLARANLEDAYLAGAYLAGANLAGANLARANLAHAYLADANLARANLAGAYLADAYLADANLARANLEDANLEDAYLAGAYLAGVRGNMREIKSAQFETWPITWTTAPDGIVTLQIGCQHHPLEMWRKSDKRWIAAMDWDAADWWAKYRDVVLALVDASPATPWGKKEAA